jgi:hypothetical protein
VALPMALVTLCMLAALSTAFVSLARTEPAIATNHLRSAAARAMAESGLERALWALTDPTTPGGFGGAGAAPNTVVNPGAAPPYDGSRFVSLGPGGGFFLSVTGTGQHLRVVRSIGRSPDGHGETPGLRASSTALIVATVARVRNLPRDAQCAICAGADLSFGPAVDVDARGSAASDCGARPAVATGGDLVFAPSVQLFGAGAGPGEGPPNLEGRDWRRNETVPDLGADDLDTLRALAAARGTYRRPASDAPFELTEARDGLVFVDTPAGTSAIAPANRAVVAIRPGFAARVPFRGWIVVNGDLSIEGHVGGLSGLLYATNSITVTGTAGSRITGMIVAAGRLGAPASSIADVTVAFDCAAAGGSGLLPSGWFVRPGAYCDRPNDC